MYTAYENFLIYNFILIKIFFIDIFKIRFFKFLHLFLKVNLRLWNKQRDHIIVTMRNCNYFNASLVDAMFNVDFNPPPLLS